MRKCVLLLLALLLALPVALAAAQLRAASAGKSPLSALNARRPVLARLLAGVLMLTAAFDATMAVDAIADGARVSVGTEAGAITNLDTGATFTAEPFPPFIAEIIEAGGLVERTRAKLAAQGE